MRTPVSILIFAVLLAACWSGERQQRFRVVVTVDTPAGPRQGSGVIGLTRGRTRTVVLGDFQEQKIEAEAIPVDLPRGRTLFLLLGAKGLPEALFNGARTAMASNIDPTGRATIPADELPLLVTFARPSDPTSVRSVPPSDLATKFGPGHALRSVTVERTTLPVTGGIEKRLPWLVDLPGSLSDRSTNGGTRLADELHGLYFVRSPDRLPSDRPGG